MVNPQPAVHRTILVVDVEGFGNQRRTNPHRLMVRTGMYAALERVFGKVGIRWDGCYHEDRGDGVLILAPPEVPKAIFVESLPLELAEALAEHNGAHGEQEQFRLRMALHAGEVSYDEHGVTAASVNLAFRLLDAPQLKAALAESSGLLAVIASVWFFGEVIQHAPASAPATYRRVQVTVKETTTVGWIALPDHPYPPAQQAVDSPPAGITSLVPRQLPARTSTFAGRVEELEGLTSILDEGAGGQEASGTVIISAINGTAGIGKTALALRWAHEVAHRFPDGQLYVNLLGFDPSVSLVRPADAIRGFLVALGVKPRGIPMGLDARAALYRGLVAGRRLLILLDNARDPDQVRPLLPASNTCLVVVTSRNQLSSLVTHEGAHPLTLDLLSGAEARDLLARHLGSARISREPEATDELIDLCARLPLALSVVAARAAAHPTFRLAKLADELRDAGRRLDALDGGDLATNVQAVFSWSYRNLGEPAALMFRMLGVHPGPDITVPAAASLAGIPLIPARRALAELTRIHLLAEHSPGRFAFHDLLRTYAAQQAAVEDTETERRAAARRMLDHYLQTAHTAVRLLYRSRETLTPVTPDPHAMAEHLADYGQALAWCDAEHDVIPAIVAYAAASGFDTHAWQIAWILATYYDRQGYLYNWVHTLHIALAAARRIADHDGQARISHELGHAYFGLRIYDEARTHLLHSLAFNREAGDRISQAHNLLDLSRIYSYQGHPDEALSHALQGLDLYRAAGIRGGEAYARGVVGRCQVQVGEYQQALACFSETIAMHREVGDRFGEAQALNNLGDTYYHLGNHAQAIAHHQRALDLTRQVGDHYMEADTLAHLGKTYLATGERDAARDAYRRALVMLDDLRHPEAEQVRVRLQCL